MISLGQFIESAHAAYKKIQESPLELGPWRLPPLDQSHIFYLGEDEDFTSAIGDIRVDLHEEMQDGVPMPFRDVSVVTIVRKALNEGEEQKLHEAIMGGKAPPSRPIMEDGEPVLIMDRLIEVGPENPAIKEVIHWGGPEVVKIVKQWFVMSRFHGYPGFKSAPLAWSLGYVGIGPGGYVRTLTLEAVRPMGQNIVSNLEQVAAISHPANYVVKVTPELSPKEARKVAAGKPRPPQKRSHFIVVDHEVLVGMRRGEGTHASPIPHQRRGHWMRLGERCRHARLLGKNKVFVKETFVGERTWADPKNLYEVLPDFGKD